MTEKLFPALGLKHLQDDPLKPFLDCFEALLSERGYTRTVIKEKLRIVTDFREWLYQQHFDLNELSDRLIDEFIGHQPDKNAFLIRNVSRTSLCRADFRHKCLRSRHRPMC